MSDCCPVCLAGGIAGITPELAAIRAPRYAEALSQHPRTEDVPAEPTAECWDCRWLRHCGVDPASLLTAYQQVLS